MCNHNLFSPAALMRMFFFCVSGTILLQYHIYQHERDTRKNFAEHILSTKRTVGRRRQPTTALAGGKPADRNPL